MSRRKVVMITTWYSCMRVLPIGSIKKNLTRDQIVSIGAMMTIIDTLRNLNTLAWFLKLLVRVYMNSLRVTDIMDLPYIRFRV